MERLKENQVFSFCFRAKKLASYEPSEEVNAFFSELCQFARDETDYELDCDPIFVSDEVKGLQEICAVAEGEMEKFWSKKIQFAQDPQKMLKSFIYYQNYEDLTGLEYALLARQIGFLQQVLFVGSWALPLTAIILAQKWGVRSVLIEKDEEAVELSRGLIEALGLQEKIAVVASDFLDYRWSETEYDAVILASLLFTSGDAEKLVDHLTRCVKFRTCLVRTARGMRQLLYKKVNEKLLEKYMKLELLVHPQNHILNSVLLYSHV